MPRVNNLKDLEKVLKPYIKKAMTLTRDQIFEIISQKISDYYSEEVFNNPLDESEPFMYTRTEQLMESLTASNIKESNGVYSFTVGFDDEYLSFKYDGNPNQPKKPHFNPATGKDVLEWLNSGLHGGNVRGGHNYLDEAMAEIESRYGGVPQLFKQNLKRVGLPIK